MELERTREAACWQKQVAAGPRTARRSVKDAFTTSIKAVDAPVKGDYILGDPMHHHSGSFLAMASVSEET